MVVEAFGIRPPEVVAPLPGEPRRADAPVDALVPAGGLLVVADGVDIIAQATSEPADGDQQRVTYVPEAGWVAGGHVVTLAAVPPDEHSRGPWLAEAVALSVD